MLLENIVVKLYLDFGINGARMASRVAIGDRLNSMKILFRIA
jgi:hypothetical protein